MMLPYILSLLAATTYAAQLPAKSLGFYCLIADDGESEYSSTSNWQPELYDYIINGSNVIWLTFINPEKMPAVPPAMANLAKCKGQPGCPGTNTPVIFSIGGEGYSKKAWSWLSSQSTAESMAAEVATWDTKYGADGVDLDIEGKAGSAKDGGQNMVYFAKKLHSLNPNMIITQPVYGYPQIDAENDVVNAAFTTNGQANGLVASVGIMLYNNLESLNYVKDYANATSQNLPIKVNVPTANILAGIQGPASDSVIQQMGNDCKQQQLGGFMVWCASVYDKTRNKAAFNYGDDASKAKSSAWAKALRAMQ